MLKRSILVLSFLVTGAAPAHAAPHTITMGTLAPERSPWGQVFRAWAKAVTKKTGGNVELTWLWNGSAGPEVTAIGKIRSGQLGGAAVTGTGLSTIYKPLTVFQIPGLFSGWSELDRARD